MKTRTMIMLAIMSDLAEIIVKTSKLSCSCSTDGDVLLWGPVLDKHWEFGYPYSFECRGEIIDLPHGLTRESIENCLTLNGTVNAVFRALAIKAGVPIKAADWWFFQAT